MMYWRTCVLLRFIIVLFYPNFDCFFASFITIPSAGRWTFCAAADDGARIILGGDTVFRSCCVILSKMWLKSWLFCFAAGAHARNDWSLRNKRIGLLWICVLLSYRSTAIFLPCCLSFVMCHDPLVFFLGHHCRFLWIWRPSRPSSILEWAKCDERVNSCGNDDSLCKDGLTEHHFVDSWCGRNTVADAAGGAITWNIVLTFCFQRITIHSPLNGTN